MATDRALRGRQAGDRLLMHARTLTEPRWQPLPHQVPPPGEWYGWLLLAGRGAGKTDACAKYVHDHVMGPPCLPGPTPHWVGIIAPTLGDAATSCFSGPSGLSAHSPEAKMVNTTGGTVVRWPNGSVAKFFGAHTPEDVERLRSGGNRCLQWLEELAAWRYLDDAWSQMRFGLRSGPRPHWVASTTPKPRPLIKRLASGGYRNVVLSKASMYDNPHLQLELREALEEEYGSTDLGRQELFAEILDEDSNALWTRAWLNESRVRAVDVPDRLDRISVGVDPSGGAGEQGIVVVGKSMQEHLTASDRRLNLAHGYVLADRTVHLRPEGWGRRAVEAAVEFEADDIVVEINFGGEMAISTIRAAADQMGHNIPIKMTRATRGKAVRAQPVSALSSQNRWHLVDRWPELEDQLCTWYPELDWSPDRLDAMVWPAWHNRIVKLTGTGGNRTRVGASPMSKEIG
jgi:phage terminase large subunit-like protein